MKASFRSTSAESCLGSRLGRALFSADKRLPAGASPPSSPLRYQRALVRRGRASLPHPSQKGSRDETNNAEGEVGRILASRDGRLYVELPVVEFGSNTMLRALPARLAWYIARSAARTNPSGDHWAPTTMPMLAEVCNR